MPLLALKVLQTVTAFFQWSRDASDRLSFANVLSNSETFTAPMADTYKMLGLDPAETTTLDSYLDDFYGRILKKLKEVGRVGNGSLVCHCSALCLWSLACPLLSWLALLLAVFM